MGMEVSCEHGHPNRRSTEHGGCRSVVDLYGSRRFETAHEQRIRDRRGLIVIVIALLFLSRPLVFSGESQLAGSGLAPQ